MKSRRSADQPVDSAESVAPTMRTVHVIPVAPTQPSKSPIQPGKSISQNKADDEDRLDYDEGSDTDEQVKLVGKRQEANKPKLVAEVAAVIMNPTQANSAKKFEIIASTIGPLKVVKSLI